jgi:hypothetical protein
LPSRFRPRTRRPIAQAFGAPFDTEHHLSLHDELDWCLQTREDGVPARTDDEPRGLNIDRLHNERPRASAATLDEVGVIVVHITKDQCVLWFDERDRVVGRVPRHSDHSVADVEKSLQFLFDPIAAVYVAANQVSSQS